MPVHELTDFIINHIQEVPVKPRLIALPKRIAVHTPCSSRKDQTVGILRLIPKLEVTLLPDNNICCGAAGSYLLTQPELSKQLGRDKLEHLKRTAPDFLVTSNTGCAIQFRLRIAQENLDIEVRHPIELVDPQMQVNDTKT